MPDNRTLNSRYTLVGEIGRGGMGVVYRAEDAQMRRVVAIKTLPSIMTHNHELMRRFNSEIQHASQLEHPNIARVYDVGEDSGTNYYVMQYIDGKSLRELLKEKGRLTLEEALPILEQVASALDYANSQGIIHRDIKPENILLDKTGNAFIVDFGIAKAAEGTRTTRGMLGTPEYMSPEQIRGEVVDGRSDQYSLAVVAYEMLTGQTPFKTEGDDPWAQIQKHLNEEVPDPKSINNSLPDYVCDTLLNGLNKLSDKRFFNSSQFIDGLQGLINSLNINNKKKLNRTKLIICFGLLISVIIATLFFYHYKTGNKVSSSSGAGIFNRVIIKEKIAYIDTNSTEMDALCVMNKNGTEKKRILWFEKNIKKYYNEDDVIAYISKNGEKFAYMLKGGLCVVDIKSGNKIDFTNKIFSPNKFTIENICDISSNGQQVLLLVNEKEILNKADINNEYIYNSCSIQLLDINKKVVRSIVKFNVKSEMGGDNYPGISFFVVNPIFNGDDSKVFYILQNGSVNEIRISDLNKRNISQISNLESVYSGKMGLELSNNYEILRLNSEPNNCIDININSGMMIRKSKDERLKELEAEYGTNVKMNENDINSLLLNIKNNYYIDNIQIDDNIGKPITEVKLDNPIGLSSGYKVLKNYYADFTGDKVKEIAYIAFSKSVYNYDVWIENKNNVVWKIPVNEFEDIGNSYCDLKAYFNDITEDGISDIFFVAYDDSAGFIFRAYSFVNGNAKLLSNITVESNVTPMIKVNNHQFQIINFKINNYGEKEYYELYQYNGDKFIVKDTKPINNFIQTHKELISQHYKDFYP